jgi:hypothetical protein
LREGISEIFKGFHHPTVALPPAIILIFVFSPHFIDFVFLKMAESGDTIAVAELGSEPMDVG